MELTADVYYPVSAAVNHTLHLLRSPLFGGSQILDLVGVPVHPKVLDLHLLEEDDVFVSL